MRAEGLAVDRISAIVYRAPVWPGGAAPIAAISMSSPVAEREMSCPYCYSTRLGAIAAPTRMAAGPAHTIIPQSHAIVRHARLAPHVHVSASLLAPTVQGRA